MGITQAQYIEMLTRTQKRSQVEQDVTEGVNRESDLHHAIIDYCRASGWVYLHGSMAEATHRTSGEADFVICADGGRVFFVECKSKIGKLSPAQLAMKCHLEKLGHVYSVVRNMEQFREAIQLEAKESQAVQPHPPSPSPE